MSVYLGITDLERMFDLLISRYDDMEKSIRKLRKVVDQNREILEDDIMVASDEILNSISSDMNKINEYITEFTGRKLDAVKMIGMIEGKGRKDIYKT